MTKAKKPFKPKPAPGAKAAAASSVAPLTSAGNTRSFDARPKPADDRRREDTVRPGHHIDTERPQLLDMPPGDED